MESEVLLLCVTDDISLSLVSFSPLRVQHAPPVEAAPLAIATESCDAQSAELDDAYELIEMRYREFHARMEMEALFADELFGGT